MLREASLPKSYGWWDVFHMGLAPFITAQKRRLLLWGASVDLDLSWKCLDHFMSSRLSA